MSIGAVLRDRKGLAPGFDLIRIILAFCIVIWHGRAIVHGDTSAGNRFFELGSWGIISAFFLLSGFLIAASAQRLPLRDFLINRSLRLFPALAVEITLSAFILGPIFTTLTLGAYFSDPQTFRYLTNIVGLITYTLPGVFEDHPTNIVNTSLWTIPHEITCYAIISAFVIFGILKRPAVVLAAAALFVAAGFFFFATGVDWLPGPLGRVVDKIVVDETSRLYVSFLLGIAAYLCRDRIPYDGRLFALAVAILVVVGSMNLVHSTTLPAFPILSVIGLPPLLYATLYIGVSSPWMPGFLKRGDYSYGIYLYGWPLQQLTLSLFPQWQDTGIQLLLSIPIILVFAMFSWHTIEKPMLGFRRGFSFIAKHRLPEAPEEPAPQAAAHRESVAALPAAAHAK